MLNRCQELKITKLMIVGSFFHLALTEALMSGDSISALLIAIAYLVKFGSDQRMILILKSILETLSSRS